MSLWQRKFIWDCIMSILIILLPFALYLHLLFDNEKESIVVLGFVYEHGFFSNRIFIWQILIKLIPSALLLIWYFNTANWWRYFIFVPLVTLLDTFFRYTFYFPDFVENNFLFFSTIFNCAILGTILILDVYVIKNLRNHRLDAPLKSIFSSLKGNFLVKLGHKPISFRVINPKIGITQKEYLKKLIPIEESLREKLKGFVLHDKLRFQFQIFDIFILMVLMSTPIIFNIYSFIPGGEKLFKFLGLELGSYGFIDASTFVWYASRKLCVMIPCCLWFITCRHWWKYAVLGPISLSAFQLWEAFQNKSQLIDELEIFQALPFISLIIMVLLLISRAVNYQTKLLTMRDSINVEIDELVGGIAKSPDVEAKRKKLNKIQNVSSLDASDRDHITDLIALKTQLLKEINTANQNGI